MRDPALQAVIEVGVDAAAFVTLLQIPATVREFASWITQLVRKKGDVIELKARQGSKRVQLLVDGAVPPESVARFLLDSLSDASTEGASPAGDGEAVQ